MMKKEKISIIFACVGNSGRSQMAEGFARKYLPVGTKIVSAGTKPAASVDPNAIAVMKEVGIDISSQKPKMLTTKMVSDATHFVSMGCGVLDSCPVPLVKGKIEIDDWELEDPKGKDIAFVRGIRDKIEQHVKDLAKKLV
ncbi:MAG: low molecular weight phosphatase family protein [Candidatus Lokiarchaeota archaeon]|nr:low molecular weight phosphatase family protein [Candidatus Lokiarchaeota archaeon]